MHNLDSQMLKATLAVVIVQWDQENKRALLKTSRKKAKLGKQKSG